MATLSRLATDIATFKNIVNEIARGLNKGPHNLKNEMAVGRKLKDTYDYIRMIEAYSRLAAKIPPPSVKQSRISELRAYYSLKKLSDSSHAIPNNLKGALDNVILSCNAMAKIEKPEVLAKYKNVYALSMSNFIKYCARDLISELIKMQVNIARLEGNVTEKNAKKHLKLFEYEIGYALGAARRIENTDWFGIFKKETSIKTFSAPEKLTALMFLMGPLMICGLLCVISFSLNPDTFYLVSNASLGYYPAMGLLNALLVGCMLSTKWLNSLQSELKTATKFWM